MSGINKWIKRLHRHEIMRAGTSTIDGKGKDDYIYCLSYSDRLSMQGGIKGQNKSWYMPSAAMVVRVDENDEQCQSQEGIHDHVD